MGATASSCQYCIIGATGQALYGNVYILADQKSRRLYVFPKGQAGPNFVPTVVMGPGVVTNPPAVQSLMGKSGTQATYNSYPLYYYTGTGSMDGATLISTDGTPVPINNYQVTPYYITGLRWWDHNGSYLITGTTGMVMYVRRTGTLPAPDFLPVYSKVSSEYLDYDNQTNLFTRTDTQSTPEGYLVTYAGYKLYHYSGDNVHTLNGEGKNGADLIQFSGEPLGPTSNYLFFKEHASPSIFSDYWAFRNLHLGLDTEPNFKEWKEDRECPDLEVWRKYLKSKY